MASENMQALGYIASMVGTYNAKARQLKITGMARYMAMFLIVQGALPAEKTLMGVFGMLWLLMQTIRER